MEKYYHKKIRILSFQNAYNFGAVLQAYGLQQTIKSLGYNDVKFINYNPKYLSDRYNPFLIKRLFPQKTLKGIIFGIVRYPMYMISRLRRNHRIQFSINNLLEQTKQIIVNECGLKDIEADVLICGSDQIWNTALTGDFDRVYLGKGPYKHLGYAAAYAPSTELSSLTEEKAKRLCGLLDSFKYISVREMQVSNKLSNYLNRDVPVCVDPTILCGAEAFCKVASPRLVEKDYIVVYAYNESRSSIYSAIKSIPNYEKYPVHVISFGLKSNRELFNARIHSAITVQEFLSYIKYAKFVVTNSFHGLAFSLLFEKNFNVIFCEGKYVRVLSLLQQLGLENRFVSDISNIQWNLIDYSIVNQKITEIRKDSFNYLNKILEG